MSEHLLVAFWWSYFLQHCRRGQHTTVPVGQSSLCTTEGHTCSAAGNAYSRVYIYIYLSLSLHLSSSLQKSLPLQLRCDSSNLLMEQVAVRGRFSKRRSGGPQKLHS